MFGGALCTSKLTNRVKKPGVKKTDHFQEIEVPIIVTQLSEVRVAIAKK
jgi:hypothetical protein